MNIYLRVHGRVLMFQNELLVWYPDNFAKVIAKAIYRQIMHFILGFSSAAGFTLSTIIVLILWSIFLLQWLD